MTVTLRRRGAILAVVAAASIFGATFSTSVASAGPVGGISIVDGETDAVFDYSTATRERVFIPVPGVDQDLDGQDDVTVIDIIRPSESGPGLTVPAIIDSSPYYTTFGRGNEGELIADLDNDGINDKWPTFIDNFFEPRGYAVILAHMDGTGFSTGCPLHGGPGDIASMKVVIDWLQGRASGHDAADNPVFATWHNGKAAMIGKSYDGTLANGVAATGVAGLTTIVPIAAITNWYGYSRKGGILEYANYPASLSAAITNPDRKALCKPARDAMSLVDGDSTGDINSFWEDRDYLKDVGNVTASVFAVNGLNDDNVNMSQLGPYWDALTSHNVPRKIWLAKVGHVDPFDYRRDVWVDTLHRWFDYWLYGVDNGIMGDPMATVETDPGVFVDYANWPVPGSQDVGIYLGGTTPGSAGALRLQSDDAVPSLTFTGPSGSASENSLMNDPKGAQSSRLVFLSQPLATDLRLSGTPRIELSASLDTSQSNLSALVVDYGPSDRTTRSGEGVITSNTDFTCWGSSSANDDGCYYTVSLLESHPAVWRVSRGVLDSSNRDSLVEGQASSVVPGQAYNFNWPLEPYDQVFLAGHRIGVAVGTNLSGFAAGTPSATVSVDTTSSRIFLPLVGGLAAADESEGFGSAAPITLDFDVNGHGSVLPSQSVEFNHAPLAPAAPTQADWVFQGWFADAALTVPFNFSTPLTSDTTAYASWTNILDLVTSLSITPSSSSVDQGATISVAVTGLDSGGNPLADVTHLATLSSSVSSDVITGNTITFVHASQHVITATAGHSVGSVSISVAGKVAPAGGSDLASTGSPPLFTPILLMWLLGVVGGFLIFVRWRWVRAHAKL